MTSPDTARPLTAMLCRSSKTGRMMPMAYIPSIAISVRQPWAWAIIHGGKDVENRTCAAVKHFRQPPMWLAIHASKGMSQREYALAAMFMERIGVRCPQPGDLLRGGIVGCVFWSAICSESSSPWFNGPRGLEFSSPAPVDFVGATGQLGMWRWSPNGSSPERTKAWMRQMPNKQGLLL